MILILFLLYLSATDIAAVNITVNCTRTQDVKPLEWYRKYPSESIPSVLSNFNIQLSNGPSLFMNISWTINVDSSIHSITGTWIDPNVEDSKYRCEYQPSFASKQINYTGLTELQFYFIATDIEIEPTGQYYVFVQNLPPPDMNSKQGSSKIFNVPGCHDERMKTHSQCFTSSQDTVTPINQIKLDYEMLSEKVSAVQTENKIRVVFTSLSSSKTYDIRLRRGNDITNYSEVKTNGEVKLYTVDLEFTGLCKNLSIWVTPNFEYCTVLCKSVRRKVECTAPTTVSATEEPKKHVTNILLINAGFAFILLIIICFLCFSKHGLDFLSAESVNVLMVYPAVDSSFQQAVLVLADFLQSHRGLKVIIDVWQRSNLAEQGPLIWLNTQIDQADKVLFILPPQHPGKENGFKGSSPKIVSHTNDYTVPASTPELYSIALNLAASSAHDSQHHAKFWVVHMGTGSHTGMVPVQLRGCKTLILLKNLEKLHYKLASTQRLLPLRCHCIQTPERVKRVLLELNQSPSLNAEIVHLNGIESPLGLA